MFIPLFHDGPLTPGLTCVFRVKNEARNLPWVLPPMFEAVHHVVLVDNDSDDGTPEVAQRVAEEHGAADRFTLGATRSASPAPAPSTSTTPPDSVHSLLLLQLVLRHVRTAYSMKWDGDMVLTAEGVACLRDLSWQLEDPMPSSRSRGTRCRWRASRWPGSTSATGSSSRGSTRWARSSPS